MKWITRERPKIDRVACPWLIARFIDADPEFLFVPPAEVLRVAAETGAIPYDVEGVELSHDGPLCSFDALLSRYALGGDDALAQLAAIVRGADTAHVELAPQCAGCSPSRWGSPACSPTITSSFATASWCTTRSMPGCERRARRRTRGTRSERDRRRVSASAASVQVAPRRRASPRWRATSSGWARGGSAGR